jgi:streptogramin lyase
VTGTWRTYSSEQGWTALPPHEYLSPGYGDGFVTDTRGRIWWATGQDDLRRFDPESQTWSAFRASDLGFEPPEDEDYQGHFLSDVEHMGTQVWVGDCVGMGEVYSGQGVRWTDGEAWFDVPFTAGQCVLDIEADDAGRIWVGGFDTLIQHDPATESWSRFPLPAWERRQLVVEIDLDGEGNPWVETLRYGGASPFGAVGHYHLQDREWIMDFEGWFGSLAFGADGAAWACSEGSIIQLQNGLAEEVDRLPGTECQVVVDGSGRVWITNHSDLWTLEPGSEPGEALIRMVPRDAQGIP